MNYASLLINRLPTVGIGRKTPMEVWSDKPATEFLGFSSDTKAYRLWCPESKKVVLSRDVTFDESGMLQLKILRKRI